VEIITAFVPGVVGRLTDASEAIRLGSGSEYGGIATVWGYRHRMGEEERYTSERGRLAADAMLVVAAYAEYVLRRVVYGAGAAIDWAERAVRCLATKDCSPTS
jgi:hypothetical protein